MNLIVTTRPERCLFHTHPSSDGIAICAYPLLKMSAQLLVGVLALILAHLCEQWRLLVLRRSVG